VQPRLDAVLGAMAFQTPAFPIVTNVEAQPNSDAARIRALLVQQVTAPVRFTETGALLLRAGVTTFIEVGPGKALIGMIKRLPGQDTPARLLNVEDPASLDATLTALAS
jgi:[acyl-carrier-protein] S-malonyltransferase